MKTNTKPLTITGFPPDERPGPDFSLKSKYASRFYRGGAKVYLTGTSWHDRMDLLLTSIYDAQPSQEK